MNILPDYKLTPPTAADLLTAVRMADPHGGLVKRVNSAAARCGVLLDAETTGPELERLVADLSRSGGLLGTVGLSFAVRLDTYRILAQRKPCEALPA